MSSVPTLEEIAAPCLSLLDDVAALAEREGDYEAADEFRALAELRAASLANAEEVMVARLDAEAAQRRKRRWLIAIACALIGAGIAILVWGLL